MAPPATAHDSPRGTKLSRQDLLHLALMSSENRAAHALCRSYPGGLRACVQAMNQKAVALGMTSAHFVEPTGLSSGNVASPVDLAKLVLAAAGNHAIRGYSTSASHTVNVNRRPLEFRNTNLLVANPAWQVDVQKTGYISEGRALPGDAGRHRRPAGGDGPAQLLWQVHAHRGRQAGPDLAGDAQPGRFPVAAWRDACRLIIAVSPPGGVK